MQKVRFFFGFVIVALSLIAGNMVFAEEQLVAVGDGFKITEDDLNAFKEFFMKHRFTSTEDEYKRAIVKLWLFSEEAKLLGLDKDLQIQQDSAEDKIRFRNELQKRYTAMIVQTYPISDLAIESYYWANPNYFFDRKDEKNPQPDLMPLDGALKEKIRQRIAAGRKSLIIEEDADKLRQKYHARICDTKENCQ